MGLLKPFQDKHLVQGLRDRIRALADQRAQYVFMEVCGTHTHAIGRWGLRDLLPDNVRLISGPGCPVCVTPGGYIDNACALACERGIVLATFGDMIRVPGDATSLEEARGKGADIRLVYSAHDVLALARETRAEVVFLAIGFETTAAGNASTIQAAAREGLGNLSFYAAMKAIPPALSALAQDSEIQVDGFLLPGHVSVILGEEPYHLLVPFGKPGAITGFEPVDILRAIEALMRAVNEDRPCIENLYPRAVRPEGNPRARQRMAEVLTPADALWRGIGWIPGSGFELADTYAGLDAARRFGLTTTDAALPPGCACGDVLKGKIAPLACPLFGTGCTPAHPVGPCMVSSEGSCSAWIKYGS